MSEFRIGQTVETSSHQQGVVKYIGPIHVAEGDWLGIDLQSPTGKNDGSVRGERYFTCAPANGLFIRESNILRIVAQPVPKSAPKPAARPVAASAAATKAAVPSKPAPATSKPRPSSVIAPKSAPRTPTIAKRQSLAGPSTYATARAIVRKASTADSSAGSSTEPTPRFTQATSVRASIAPSSTSSAVRPSRDSNIDTLQTKIRHLEKQHADDQERLKELTHARDERDRFHSIIQKLQAKCQTLHQDAIEAKAQLQGLQSDNDQLSKAHQEHEVDLEDALVDKEMAEERAEQAESELDTLRSKLEERDMELDILRSEAELFTTDMSEEERQEAGYYRLQHENDRLRQALITLKEMTGEQEQDLKARLREIEADANQVESLRLENSVLQDRINVANSNIEHLRAQLDANAEWEDVSNELTTKNQELEDKVVDQAAVIRDLESLKELNDELEAQRADEAEDLHAELAAKDIELAEQYRRIEDQETVIADQQTLISKFRELVFELQGRMADAESSRNMTEAQVKDTTSRFNKVMNLNRQLRASNVDATIKEIDAELCKVKADEVSERLAIVTETGSIDFANSDPVQAYFTLKAIAAKASLASSLLSTTDRQLSYNGGMKEASSRLSCVQAIQHLTVIQSGSNRLWSAVQVSSLSDLSNFGPLYHELEIIEKAVDQGLTALVTDEVKFRELAGAFEKSTKFQEAIISSRHETLSTLPEDETLAYMQKITAHLSYLDSNFAIVKTMLTFLATNGTELLEKAESETATSNEIADKASKVLEQFTPPSIVCNKTMGAAKRMMKTIKALRHDSLFPHVSGGIEALISVETYLSKLAHEAVQWGQNALRIVNSMFDETSASNEMELDLHSLLSFYWSAELHRLDFTATQLDNWIEEASVLMNCSEIQRGPTPWSQKAKEVEAARKKDLEASLMLENLKTEHKATLLSLHERERVIETKNLEIEHLDAKYRDATNKAGDTQQLRDKIKEAEHEVAELRKQVRTQQLKMQAMEEHATRSTGSDHNPIVPVVSNTAKEPTEQLPMRSIPAGLNSLLDALQHENHWLRRREYADVFDRNLRDMAAKMWAARRWDEIMIDEELSDDDNDLMPGSPVKPSRHTQEDRHKGSPLELGSVRTGWEPRFESHVNTWLSIVEDEDDTLALEEFSELPM